MATSSDPRGPDRPRSGSPGGNPGRSPGAPGGGRSTPDRSVLGTLFRYELKMLLRDKRTIFFSVVLPLILLPGLILIMRFTERQAEERAEARTYEYAVVGTEAGYARDLIDRGLALARSAGDGDEGAPITLEEADLPEAVADAGPTAADSALSAGDIHVVVHAMTAAEARARQDSIEAARDSAEAEEPGARTLAEEAAEAEAEAAAGEADEREVAADGEGGDGAVVEDGTVVVEDGPDVPVLELRYRGNSETSEDGMRRLRSLLTELRTARRNDAYREAGLPVDPAEVAAVELDEAASAERESGAMLALWLTPLLVMLMLSGGSIVAADTISGEKERGTLETLLTTGARRRDIVWAKLALIITTGIAIAVINVANLALYLGFGLFELPDRFTLSVDPVTLALLLALFLPLTVLISSVLLILSGYAKSYKEYQLYFFPIMIAFLLPASAAVLPGMELASVVAVIPLANISVAVREVLVGEYHWAALGVAVGTTTALAAWLARLTERTLSTEKLITAAETDEADLKGGPALFPRHVLRWFAVLWALLFVSSSWLGGELGIRGQATFNIIGLFGGGTLLMLQRYRLDPRKALALRMPRPMVWPAVLIGAPAALVVGVAVTQLGQLIFPIPDRVIESFGQFMLDDQLPLWQVVLFLCIMPGIFEELAFRGVLLHGLRKRLRPIALALAVGAIFGFFHVSLFRILPTGYLGVILAAVTLLTGSIYPAMLWHTLNNAVALVPTYMGWVPDDLSFPWWAYVVAAGALAVAFRIIWDNRTPYPGVKDADQV